MELLFDPAAWASLITLTALEIVLGIDNIVVLSILTHALPPREAQRARAAGLGLALALRLALLSAISWLTRLTYPVFSAAGEDFSWRDLILIGGGLFLMVKATQEIHAEIEGRQEQFDQPKLKPRFGAVISQIAVMDLVFSLDSIITAVGLARDIEVMAAAICIAIAIMYAAAQPVGGFIKRHPTAKMLGLCFLILIGVALIADGFGFHIPRGYIYFAMAFAGMVETLNIRSKGSGSHLKRTAPPLDRPPARSALPESARLKTAAVSSAPGRKAKARRKKNSRK
jgi:predicted tellurium resistance membrane protein TerC